MATGTAGSIARKYHTSQIHYLRADFNVAEVDVSGGVTKTLGTIPAGSIVLRGMVVVTTAFNWGTNNLIDVGPAADPDGYATIMSLLTIGNIVFDEMATTNDQYVTVDTPIYAQMQCTGTAATTGAGFVIVEFVENLGDMNA